MPPSGQNPYDFILSGPQKAPSQIIPTGNSTKQRLIIMAAGLVVVLLFFVLLFGVIMGHKNGNTEELEQLASAQYQLMQISSDNASQVNDPGVQAFAQNVSLVTSTSQQATLDYLSQHGHKLKDKQLAAGGDSSVQQKLTDAQSTGNFDGTLLGILETGLKNYQTELATAYKETGSASQKQLLQQCYTQVSGLLQNLPAAPSV